VFYFFEGDLVVDEAEEAVSFGGVHELGCYFVDAVLEVMEGDFRDRAVGVLGWCHCVSVTCVRPRRVFVGRGSGENEKLE
jgi:hypothetical protein